MKFTQSLFAIAAAAGVAQAGWNATTTAIITDVTTVPCTTSTGTAVTASASGVIVPPSNGTTYTVPVPTAAGSTVVVPTAGSTGTGSIIVPTVVPTTPVTAGAGALDARVFVGAAAAVAAIAFTL